MTEAGFTIAGENHPICPVMLGDARLASQFADAMLGKFSFLWTAAILSIIWYLYHVYHLQNKFQEGVFNTFFFFLFS